MTRRCASSPQTAKTDLHRRVDPAARGRAEPVHRPARRRCGRPERRDRAARRRAGRRGRAVTPIPARPPPARRPAVDADRPRRGARRGGRPHRPRGRRAGAGGGASERGSGCGSPASTPSSPSRVRPAAASRRCSTRWPAPTSRRSGSAGRRRRRPTPASGASEGAAPLVEWLGVPRRQTAWQHSDLDLAQQGDLDGPGPARPARPRLHRHRAPAGGRPARRAGRPARLGGRPAEVRRRGAARALPAQAGRARRGDAGGAQPDRHR